MAQNMAENIAQNMAQNMAEKTNSLDRSLTLPAVKNWTQTGRVRPKGSIIPKCVFPLDVFKNMFGYQNLNCTILWTQKSAFS